MNQLLASELMAAAKRVRFLSERSFTAAVQRRLYSGLRLKAPE